VAQQLRDRLNAVFSDRPWRDLQAAGAAAGTRIADVKAMVVHQTSGWPPRSNGVNMFNRAFRPVPPPPPPAPAPPPPDRLTTQLYVAGDGTVLQGMQLPNHTHHAGFVNNWSLGTETGHGVGNYVGNDHLGPFSSSDSTKVPNPSPPPLRIPGPTYGAIRPLSARPGNVWITLSGDGTIDDAGDDDLPGIKFWVRHQLFPEVALGIWTTPRYDGPWRQQQRVPEMLFTEGQYRAWALLARWIAEEYLLPRNFSLLPHKVRDGGFGDVGSHSTLRDAASFSRIVLADEGLSRSPQTFGLPAAPVPPTAAALEAAYAEGVETILNRYNRPVDRNRHWQAMFGVYRGFHGHGYSGDAYNGDHDCPGPMFDWHRFAREVWDWWWWPFDFATATPNAAVAARPYSLATRDGSTPLKEYFWSTLAATIQGRVREGIHGARSSPQTFELPQNSRIYALANGELVAARFPAETGQVSLAFLLVRHEVFHQLDPRPPAPGTPTTLPVFANRIDYNNPPSSVYSLYMHLGRPAGMSFDVVAANNPDWLNRVLARKTEAERGVAFRASPAGQAIPAATWNDRPPGDPRRPTLLEAWTADHAGLTAFLNTLRAGNLAVVPLDADATPIRILLGDYLANSGVISRDQATGTTRRGVRVEVFSSNRIGGVTDFIFLDTTDSGGGWQPPAATGEPPILRYPSEWARDPTSAERAALEAQGVPTGLVNWWATVALATLNRRVPVDALLFAGGQVIHYDPLTFLPWLNTRTWRSEWPKYRATDPAVIPAAPRPR
jgi:hypothetical protein